MPSQLGVGTSVPYRRRILRVGETLEKKRPPRWYKRWHMIVRM
jgi:hypothetical protein